MTLAAALIYWVIVILWLTVLGTLAIFYVRNPRAFGATRLLLGVLAIDTSRHVIENVYFGFYFGGQYGIFPPAVANILGNPGLPIVPKLINIAAGCIVLSLLLMRCLPSAIKEHEELQNSANVAQTLSGLMGEFVANVSHELRDAYESERAWSPGAFI